MCDPYKLGEGPLGDEAPYRGLPQLEPEETEG